MSKGIQLILEDNGQLFAFNPKDRTGHVQFVSEAIGRSESFEIPAGQRVKIGQFRWSVDPPKPFMVACPNPDCAKHGTSWSFTPGEPCPECGTAMEEKILNRV